MMFTFHLSKVLHSPAVTELVGTTEDSLQRHAATIAGKMWLLCQEDRRGVVQVCQEDKKGETWAEDTAGR